MASRGQLPVIPSLWSLDQPESGEGRHEDTLDLAKGLQHESRSHTKARTQNQDGHGWVEIQHPLSADSPEATSPPAGFPQGIGLLATSVGLETVSKPMAAGFTAKETPQRDEQSPIDGFNGRRIHAGSLLVKEAVVGDQVTQPMTAPPAAQDLSPSNGEANQSEPRDSIFCKLGPEALLTADSTPEVVSSSPLLDPSLTFLLHSRPGASKIIYLDFDGHTTSGTAWNDASMGASFYSPAYDIDGNAASFSSTELTRIQQVWMRVAADYAPFGVDVTTQAPPSDWLVRSSSSDSNYGIHVVITSYGPYSSSAGGIAFVDSFTDSQDTPAFVYNIGAIGISEATSHEVGHSLGLSHDGQGGSEYYAGHGTGETGWAPIMGVGYNKSVTTWDNGTYYNSNNGGSTANYGNGPDDIAVISTRNGFGTIQDQIGNSITSAAPLTITAGNVTQFGTIEMRTDSDWFSFQLLDIGSLNLSFDPYWYRAFTDNDGIWGGSSQATIAPMSDIYPSTTWVENSVNLDLSVSLYSSTGQLLASSNPTGLAASLSTSGLSAGTYYVSLDGVGFGDPTSSTPTGYSDYGSLGNYWISGSITNAADNSGPPPQPLGDTSPLPTLTIADLNQSEGSGSSPSIFQVKVSLSAPSSSDVTVNFSTADGTSLSSGTSSDYASSSGTLLITAGNTSGTISIAVSADTSVEANETFLVNLSSASGATILDSQALVTILNDDITSGNAGKKKGPSKTLRETSSALAHNSFAATVDPITGEALNRAVSAGLSWAGKTVGMATSRSTQASGRTDSWVPYWSNDPAMLAGGDPNATLGQLLATDSIFPFLQTPSLGSSWPHTNHIPL